MGNIVFIKRLEMNRQESARRTRVRQRSYSQLEGLNEKANFIALYNNSKEHANELEFLKWDLLSVFDTRYILFYF